MDDVELTFRAGREELVAVEGRQGQALLAEDLRSAKQG